jgi:hypothetical protein
MTGITTKNLLIKIFSKIFLKKRDLATLYLYGGIIMFIETTANIDADAYRTIKATSKMLGVSARKLVNLLLKIVVKEMPFDYRIYRTVEYQADRPVEDWICFHLRSEPQNK